MAKPGTDEATSGAPEDDLRMIDKVLFTAVFGFMAWLSFMATVYLHPLFSVLVLFFAVVFLLSAEATISDGIRDWKQRSQDRRFSDETTSSFSILMAFIGLPLTVASVFALRWPLHDWLIPFYWVSFGLGLVTFIVSVVRHRACERRIAAIPPRGWKPTVRTDLVGNNGHRAGANVDTKIAHGHGPGGLAGR